jgi:hypothetical protein
VIIVFAQSPGNAITNWITALFGGNDRLSWLRTVRKLFRTFFRTLQKASLP